MFSYILKKIMEIVGDTPDIPDDSDIVDVVDGTDSVTDDIGDVAGEMLQPIEGGLDSFVGSQSVRDMLNGGISPTSISDQELASFQSSSSIIGGVTDNLEGDNGNTDGIYANDTEDLDNSDNPSDKDDSDVADDSKKGKVYFTGDEWDCVCRSCLCKRYRAKSVYDTHCFYCGHSLNDHTKR